MQKVWNKILFYRPEIIAFFSGACVMIFELLWARVVGPYIGTSLFVWTSLIAIILWALSIGCYYGGKFADKRADMQILSLTLLLAGASILILLLSKDFFLTHISRAIPDVRLSSIIITLILFSPTSVLLWFLSPIVTKLRLTQMHTSWAVVGKIWSIGTLWSILGTLGAGFFLIPFFWVTQLLIMLSISCILISLLCDSKKYLFLQIFLLLTLTSLSLWNRFYAEALAENNYFVYDTAYSHVRVSERTDNITQNTIRDLQIDNVTHAWMYVWNNDLVYPYTKYYHLFDVFVPKAKNMLMLGGAAYSFPKSFLTIYPDKNLDVVEIDSQITQIARKHFWLVDDPRLKIFHQDARVFLRNNEEKYDAILADAFGSFFSIPYQLTTLELAQRKYDLLTDNWVVILNIISSLEWKKALFLEAEYKTYSQVFPYVSIIPVHDPHRKNISQNIMLVAAKNPKALNLKTQNPIYQSYIDKISTIAIKKETPILTDNYAPVDYYISKMR